MAGLDVLSASGFMGTTGSDLNSSVKEKASSDSNLSEGFAEILGGWLFLADGLAGSKGQDSGEEKPGDDTNQSGLHNLLAGLLEFSQMESLIQNYFPAGKEANSGAILSQGNAIFDRIAKTGLADFGPLETIGDLQQTGVKLSKPTGDSNPTASELVKYKMIISELLKNLSGEIKVLDSASLGKPMTGFNFTNVKADNLLKVAEALAQRAQILPFDNNTAIPQEVITQNLEDGGKSIDLGVSEQEGFPGRGNSEKGSFNSMGNNREKGLLQANFNDEVVKNGDMILTDNPLNRSIPGSSALQDAAENGSSVASKATIPLWEQIAASIQRYAVAQHQEIRGFELQLHPEDLGKIQVNLHWENGHINIHCQASESSTVGILQQNLVQLRESLENNGISCGMMQMGPGGQEQQKKPSEEAKPNIKVSTPESEDINSLARVVSYSASYLSNEHLINLTA